MPRILRFVLSSSHYIEFNEVPTRGICWSSKISPLHLQRPRALRLSSMLQSLTLRYHSVESIQTVQSPSLASRPLFHVVENTPETVSA